MLPATFVINLERSSERMAAMDTQLRAARVAYTRFPAVDGTRADTADTADATAWCARHCTPAMLGCTLSHIHVWRHVVDHALPCALVLEDDVTLAPDFARRLMEALRRVPADYDVLYLGCFGLCSPDGLSALAAPVVRMVTGRRPRSVKPGLFVPAWPLGSHAYIVSAKGARKLHGMKAGWYVDNAMAATCGLNLYAVKPALAWQTDMNDSTISDYAFPKTLNWALGHVRDGYGVPLSYFSSVPFGQVRGVVINAWLLASFFVGASDMHPAWVAAFFGVEAALGPSTALAACLGAYVLGTGVRLFL